jgi:AAA15 family ATPase/GTPase
MIQFERIKVKNFLSYGNAWSEIDLNLGKALVVAENGAGKCVDPDTTMIDV